MGIMSIIGFIANNWWLWFIGLLVFGGLFWGILAMKAKKAYDSIKADPFGILAEKANEILEDPETAARNAAEPAKKTLGELIIVKLLTGLFGGLFIISALINIALFILSRFWPQI